MCFYIVNLLIYAYASLLIGNTAARSFPSKQEGHFRFHGYFITNSTSKFELCQFPRNIHVQIVTKQQREFPSVLKLNLERYDQQRVSVPPFGTDGTRESAKLAPYPTDEKSTVYSSFTDGVHIVVQCYQKSTRALSIRGVIIYHATEYSIHSVKELKNIPLLNHHENVTSVVIQRTDGTPKGQEYTISEKSRFIDFETQSPSLSSSHVRDRRDVIDLTKFTIDMLVVVDYSVYKTWLPRTNSRPDKEAIANIKKEILKYYTHVINGVDLRYKNIGFTDFQIRVKLSGVIIVDNKDIYPWTERDKETNASRIDVNADKALKYFRSWINETKGLPEHDHAVLFTGYDLYTKSNEKKITHTSGLAFIGTMCQVGDSLSIVEEQGGFQSIGTTAHELGHSLGALHDGENNTCSSGDRYIMASSGFGPVPDSKKLNPWQFSDCSVEYLKNFVTLQLSEGGTCLLESSVHLKSESSAASENARIQTRNSTTNENRQRTESQITNGRGLPSILTLPSTNRESVRHEVVANENQDIIIMPGQDYSPDEQCRLIWGKSSYLCRGDEFGNASTICTAMYCRDPSTVNDCVLHTAARGTSCGNKKWCIHGQCTASENAPVKPDRCILGDQPGFAFNGMTCSGLVSRSIAYCYQDKVRARCCQSCGNQLRPRKGCEFGDRVQGCLPWHCTHVFETRNIMSDCCATCKTGDLISTATLTNILSNAMISSDKSVSTTLANTMSVCEDDVDVNGATCSEHIRSRGLFVCYSHTFAKRCCESCNRIRTHINGCEYGDRTPALCERLANMTSLACNQFHHHCCESCTPGDTIRNASSRCQLSAIAGIMFIIVNMYNYYLGM